MPYAPTNWTGVIDAAFFERRAAEWRREQLNLLRLINQHQRANQNYFDEGAQLLDLARHAPEQFARQASAEERRLLEFVLSYRTWANGKLL